MGQEIPSVVLSSFFGRNYSLAPYLWQLELTSESIVIDKEMFVKCFLT
jgi:hypothetical protein